MSTTRTSCPSPTRRAARWLPYGTGELVRGHDTLWLPHDETVSTSYKKFTGGRVLESHGSRKEVVFERLPQATSTLLVKYLWKVWRKRLLDNISLDIIFSATLSRGT